MTTQTKPKRSTKKTSLSFITRERLIEWLKAQSPRRVFIMNESEKCVAGRYIQDQAPYIPTLRARGLTTPARTRKNVVVGTANIWVYHHDDDTSDYDQYEVAGWLTDLQNVFLDRERDWFATSRATARELLAYLEKGVYPSGHPQAAR